MSLNLQQSIEVIVRIKPLSTDQENEHRCIILSDCQENTIVVESQNKKQLFSFDYIASESCTQQQLYQKLGEPVLRDSFKGYNCCVFSYGQTGAGKTYSVLGQSTDLLQDPSSETRGILPRMLEQMFEKINNTKNNFDKVNVRCSYLQIYNEQIIDLLTKQSRNLTIREDISRGVFVDGLTELSINNYEEALSIMTKGLLVRKTSSTFMNSQSSRSHTIFTILLMTESFENDIRKTVNSKLHIVDLAGSQRIKLTKVEGQRLKQGCNINKSLLTLSHVISSLVEAGKKKKHIPFRDSKLTFFLKDSLGGNSKTKLLANISPRALYIGDTISTLMFAKRVKIIKSIAKPNQNFADNFQSLRLQIRQLRQELAQTKFIQNLPPQYKNTNTNNIRLQQSIILSRDLSLPTQSFILQSSTNHCSSQSLKVFQQNQVSYRSIIQNCFIMLRSQKKIKQTQVNFKKIFDQKKNLEKIVGSQNKLISNFPRFTYIFKQNIEYKRRLVLVQKQLKSSQQQIIDKLNQINNLNNNIQLLNIQIEELQNKFIEIERQKEDKIARSLETSKLYDKIISSGKKDHIDYSSMSHKTSKSIPNLQFDEFKVRRSSLILTKRIGYRDIVQRQNDMISQYQTTLNEITKKFQQTMNELKSQYIILQEMYHEQKRQKYEICKKKKKQPQLQTLNNQNQYLKLNIMDLQSQITQLQDNLFKKQIQIKTNNQQINSLLSKIQKNQKSQLSQNKEYLKQNQLQYLIDKIQIIKLQAEKANMILNEEMQREQMKVIQLQARLSKINKDNYVILENQRVLIEENAILRQKLGQYCPDVNKLELIMTQVQNQTQNQVDKTSYRQNLIQEIQKLILQKQTILIQKQYFEKQNTEHKSLLQKSSTKILNLTKDMNIFKDLSMKYEQQVIYLYQKSQILEKQNKQYIGKSKMIEIQLSRIIKEYQKQEMVLDNINNELNVKDGNVIYHIKLIQNKNKLLLDQNQKLKGMVDETKKRQYLVKNSKSISNFNTLRENKEREIVYRNQLQNHQVLPKFNRQLITELKRKNKQKQMLKEKQKEKVIDKEKDRDRERDRQKQKQTPKKNILISSFHLQKQKGVKVLPKPLTQQGMNKVRKDSKNK